jgi:hypothetical protein
MDTSDIANSFTGLIAFVGGRHIISEFYDSKKDYLSNPVIKIIIIISILYINIKDIKITIFIFFIYMLFVESKFASSTQNDDDPI